MHYTPLLMKNLESDVMWYKWLKLVLLPGLTWLLQAAESWAEAKLVTS